MRCETANAGTPEPSEASQTASSASSAERSKPDRPSTRGSNRKARLEQPKTLDVKLHAPPNPELSGSLDLDQIDRIIKPKTRSGTIYIRHPEIFSRQTLAIVYIILMIARSFVQSWLGRAHVMNKGRNSDSSLDKDEKVGFQEISESERQEILNRPGIQEVLKVHQGWKIDAREKIELSARCL